MANNLQNNNFQISGKIVHVGLPEDYITRNGTSGTSRQVVMEVFSGQYSSEVPFDFNNTNMKAVADMKEGEWWTITFELRGNKSNKAGKDKWFSKNNALTAIKG